MVKTKKEPEKGLKYRVVKYHRGYIILIGDGVVKRQGSIRVYVTKQQAEASMKAIIESLIKTSNQLKDEENAKATPEGVSQEG